MPKAEQLSTSRLEAFSDGVIAFAATLLVVGVTIPHLTNPGSAREMAGLLRDQIPNFLIYAVSFGTLTVWWLAHHQLFHHIRSTDRVLLLLNGGFLFFIAFLPFPTSLVGQYPSNPAASSLYGIVGGLTGICVLAIRLYAGRPGGPMDAVLGPDDRRRFLRRSAMSPCAYFGGAVLALFHPGAALALYAAIAIYFVIPLRRRAAAQDGAPGAPPL